LFLRWGVRPGPWLWPVELRVLFVLDGRINTSTNPGSFGLGFVLETLTDPAYSWWARFAVDVVRRDDGHDRNCMPDEDTYFNLQQLPFEKAKFSFTAAGFSLDAYDQVWFFGDYPANQDNPIDYPAYHSLGDVELRLIAEWMERGGGVFATGDHENLGASMCSRLPRVRTMRRWTEAQGVPPQHGPYRNETLQGIETPEAIATGDDPREGDTDAQPIEPVYVSRSTSILARPHFPHSLLSAPDGGVIHRFPDHMHEGEVVDDGEVELDLPLDIPGYDGLEYPFASIVVGGGAAVAAAAVPGVPRYRPTPRVVAYGSTTIPKPLQPVGTLARYVVPPGTLAGKRFPLLGAYDGDAVGIGRVVVDSTWHHWFTFNLHGFHDDADPAEYELMQAYYRNVGLWLATPAQRQTMLVAAIWGIVVSDPMAFPAASDESLWGIGRRVLAVLARTGSPGTIFDLVASHLGDEAEDLMSIPAGVDPSDPYAESLEVDLVSRALVGSIATSLLRPASDYREGQRKHRRLLNGELIAHHANEGVERGLNALIQVARARAEAAHGAADLLERGTRAQNLNPIQIPVHPIRVVADRLQLPDPTDPELAGKTVTVTARISLSGEVVAHHVIDLGSVKADARRITADLERVLFEGSVQNGETLRVEILAGAVQRDAPGGEQTRYDETLTGAPDTWIGPQAPRLSDLWRLWYRVESFEVAERSV
jgi:hypothetical protein